jgi:hypothetical protein
MFLTKIQRPLLGPTASQAISRRTSAPKKRLLAAVGLILLASVFVAGIFVWKNATPKPTYTTTGTDIDTTVNWQPEGQLPTSFAAYQDQDLGLGFSYPARWGTPVKKTMNDPRYPDRHVPSSDYTRYDISFPRAPLFILPIVNGKNNYLVQHAGCFAWIGLLDLTQSDDPDSLKPSGWVQSGPAGTNQYATYRKVLVGDSKTLYIMNFDISTTVNPTSYCNGFSMYGSQDVIDNARGLQKVQFVWTKSAVDFGKSQPRLGVSDLEDFKKNQQKYISDQDLRDLQTTIQSMHSI